MNIGVIVKPNQKGQIVIPKEIRDELDITENTHLNIVVRGEGVYIYPIDEVLTKVESESPYLTILKKTQGAWADDKSWDKTEKRRRKIELAASLSRKKTW